MTAEEALRRLLAGTGVTYRFTAVATVTLDVSGPGESVDVVGDPVPLSSPKYTEPLRNVPQTINVITKEVIEEQAATTLRDVLRNVPGIVTSIVVGALLVSCVALPAIARKIAAARRGRAGS